MNPQIVLTLLDQFQLTVDGQPITGLTSEKIQALIAYVTVEQERAHSRESLAELFWPDRPDGAARQNLRQALSRLQRALPTKGESLLTISRNEVRFNSDSNTQIDVIQFITVLGNVRAHPHDTVSNCLHCCQSLATAVDYYRGDFLATLSCDSPHFDEWRLLKAAWLRRELIQALDTLVHHHEAAAQWRQAYRFAWRSVEIDPLREVAHQQVMRALASSGRRKAALDQYATLVQLLRDELDVTPTRASTALFEAIRDGQSHSAVGVAKRSSPSSPNNSPPPHNLPSQHTAFIGRGQELQRIAERLARPECHLLTLVGPGGVGKTRLALEAAKQALARAQPRYADGIYLVALAAAEEEEQILSAIAAAIGYHFPEEARGNVARQRALLHHLQSQQLLLLLDNYEQLATSTDLILAILAEAPRVQLLVTSRVSLHLRAEWLIDIVGLAHPDTHDLELGEQSMHRRETNPRAIATFEAVQFFTEAAQRRLPDFTLSDQTLSIVGRLCLLTEGLPLALELAAAQIRAVPLPVLVEAVQENVDTLATTMRDVPSRHRSLRAVFDHSWRLLTPPLQRLFPQLALFRGPFSAEAAMAVTGCHKKELDQLCNASLLREVTDLQAEPGYTLHEVLRQYAMAQLERAPAQEQRTRRAHSHYYLALVAETETLINGHDAAQGVAVLQHAVDDIRAAWQWATATDDLPLLQQSIPTLLRFFVLTGQAEEGSLFADGALRQVAAPLQAAADGQRRGKQGDEHARQQLCADLYAMRARMFFKQARYTEGIADAAQAVAIADACNAPRSAALGNLYWGICLLNQGEYRAAQEKLIAAHSRARVVGWRKIESDALRALGTLAHMQNDLSAARHYYEESLTISQALDDPRGSSAALGNVGIICRQQGDFDAARRFLTESLAIHRQIADRSSEGRTLSLLGELSTDLEEYEKAESYFGDALHLLRSLGEAHYAADALVALGKVYHAQGRNDLARACWQEAAATYRATNDAPLLAEVEQYLAQVQGIENATSQSATKGLSRL